MRQYLDHEVSRVCLRPLNFEDARSFALLLGGDAHSISMMDRMPQPCTRQSAKDWIEDHTAPGSVTFGIVRKSDRDFLGAIGLNTDESVPELGYWVGRPYWSHGYATEAVRVIETVAGALGIGRLAAKTFASNRASQRVLAKAGFYQKGIVDRGPSTSSYTASSCGDIVYHFEKPLC